MSEGAPEPLWQVRFPLPAAAIDDVMAALGDEAQSLAAFETEDGAWVGELLVASRPEPTAIAKALGAVLGAAAPPPKAIEVRPLAQRDWLEATRRSFPPRRVERFWVHGSHVTDAAPEDAVPLLIDAGTAFGSGEHGSTTGCLMAIDRLARRRRAARVLDMGCGSAILAIAALKTWPTSRAVGADIDPPSVAAARENAARNGVSHRLRAIVADGYDHQLLRRDQRFDLVLANILAGPLAEMAPDLARTLAPRGRAVLAGLLDVQARDVLLAHRRQGLVPAGCLQVGVWSALILRHQAGFRRRPRLRYASPFAVERWPMKPA